MTPYSFSLNEFFLGASEFLRSSSTKEYLLKFHSFVGNLIVIVPRLSTPFDIYLAPRWASTKQFDGLRQTENHSGCSPAEAFPR